MSYSMRHAGEWRWKTALWPDMLSNAAFKHTSAPEHHCQQRLEALSVDNGRAGLVVLALGDPHLLEGAQRRQDGASDPHRVLALGRGHHLDLHRVGSKGHELLRHALSDAGEHGGASR